MINLNWLSVKEVAQLEGLDKRTIQRYARDGVYAHVRKSFSIGGKSGERYEISLESLSDEVRAAYHNQIIDPNHAALLKYTGEQRKQADFKALVISQYQQSALSIKGFIAKFNQGNQENAINRHKLMRWQNKYKKSGNVADLIDNRGGHNRGQTSIPVQAWEYFYSLNMTQQKRSIQRCWELTQKEYHDIPSVSAFERKVKDIPSYAIIQYREGKKALNDKLPSMRRSRADIASNDIWFSDHHQCDVIVLDERGRPARLWLTPFFDARSNRVMSYIARSAEPNATVIKQCFRQGIEKNQAIPREVYFDNGKDYRSRSFSEDYPLSLVNQLGVKTIHATPYHGQAKTVERFFGTLEGRFANCSIHILAGTRRSDRNK